MNDVNDTNVADLRQDTDKQGIRTMDFLELLARRYEVQSYVDFLKAQPKPMSRRRKNLLADMIFIREMEVDFIDYLIQKESVL